ncbi:MAG: alpha/beta hydrolase, partial [Acidimicrobiia bacterium]|nr:alpha/beta hydrolase [Acidimicrobiia bacterium]
MRFATAYYHWFFLIQPHDLPERLIGADPEYYLRMKLGKLGGGGAGLAPFAPEALVEYLRCFRDPRTIHASCEDYRAAATIDLEHDEADLNRKLACPLLALWGEHGTVGRCFDVVGLWRERAEDVRGAALPGGHYLPE